MRKPKYKIEKLDHGFGLTEYRVKFLGNVLGTFRKRKLAQIFVKALKS
jgi:hypothetical protein